MKLIPSLYTFIRLSFALLFLLVLGTQTFAQTDPLPSWNDGNAKQAIVDFVQAPTRHGSPKFVAPTERIATFDQDGTLWVEPFKAVVSGDQEAIARLLMDDLFKILAATLTGMSVDEFRALAQQWLDTARVTRWKRLHTELTYQPMQEVLQYLRANGYKTYIVTGGGQDFVRVYSERTYGIPPEQVVDTAGGTKYGYGKYDKPFLTKEPKLLLNDNNAGKPEGIHLMIGRRPHAAFGNSTGNQQMLEYIWVGEGTRLAMLMLHDNIKREYAYGPAQGLPDTHFGALTQTLYGGAQKQAGLLSA